MISSVLDANVLVSALTVKVGKPAQILPHLNRLVLLTSEAILAEVERVLHYPRIQRRYQLHDEVITEYLQRLRVVSTIVAVRTSIAVIAADPDDDKFLACALDGGAEYIVSGDPHLLSLQQYQHIRMITPADFLALLNQHA